MICSNNIGMKWEIKVKVAKRKQRERQAKGFSYHLVDKADKEESGDICWHHHSINRTLPHLIYLPSQLSFIPSDYSLITICMRDAKAKTWESKMHPREIHETYVY